MEKTKKKRGRGRPKLDNPRVNPGWSYSPQTIEMLNDLVARYKAEAPSFFSLSPPLVVEAILQHAHREELSFHEAFGVISGSAAEKS